MDDLATEERITAMRAQTVAYATILHVLIDKLTKSGALSTEDRQALYTEAAKELAKTRESGELVTRMAIDVVRQLGSVVGSD